MSELYSQQYVEKWLVAIKKEFEKNRGKEISEEIKTNILNSEISDEGREILSTALKEGWFIKTAAWDYDGYRFATRTRQESEETTKQERKLVGKALEDVGLKIREMILPFVKAKQGVFPKFDVRALDGSLKQKQALFIKEERKYLGSCSFSASLTIVLTAEGDLVKWCDGLKGWEDENFDESHPADLTLWLQYGELALIELARL